MFKKIFICSIMISSCSFVSASLVCPEYVEQTMSQIQERFNFQKYLQTFCDEFKEKKDALDFSENIEKKIQAEKDIQAFYDKAESFEKTMKDLENRLEIYQTTKRIGDFSVLTLNAATTLVAQKALEQEAKAIQSLFDEQKASTEKTE